MQKLIKLLLLSLLLCLLPSTSIAQKTARKTRKPAAPSIICKVASVPNGMMVLWAAIYVALSLAFALWQFRKRSL